jgi:predicted O-methyltransferase YrrM
MQPISLIFKQFISETWPVYGGIGGRKTTEKLIRKYYHGSEFSVSEKRDFGTIEAVRKLMLSGDETIPVEEFGAGSNTRIGDNAGYEKVRDVCRISSMPKSHCLFLYRVIREIKPAIALELGTCLGISTAYQALALKRNQTGKIFTLEGSAARGGIAEKNFRKLELGNYIVPSIGKFEDILEIQLQSAGSPEYAFIDGHHDEGATLHYFNQILPWLKKGGIMIFDDIFWSAGMFSAWNTIKSSPSVKEWCAFKGMGILVI